MLKITRRLLSTQTKEFIAPLPPKPRPQKDNLVLKRLDKIKARDTISIFTESTRLNKSIVCLLEEKMHLEFPKLKEYAHKDDGDVTDNGDHVVDGVGDDVGVVELQGCLRWESSGSLYPGVDLYPDQLQNPKSTVEISLSNSKLDEATKKLMIAIVSHQGNPDNHDNVGNQGHVGNVGTYDQKRNVIRLHCDFFPSLSENKRWLNETIGRLVSVAQENVKSNQVVNVSDEKIEQVRELTFPEAWKRLDQANVSYTSI